MSQIFLSDEELDRLLSCGRRRSSVFRLFLFQVSRNTFSRKTRLPFPVATFGGIPRAFLLADSPSADSPNCFSLQRNPASIVVFLLCWSSRRELVFSSRGLIRVPSLPFCSRSSPGCFSVVVFDCFGGSFFNSPST